MIYSDSVAGGAEKKKKKRVWFLREKKRKNSPRGSSGAATAPSGSARIGGEGIKEEPPDLSWLGEGPKFRTRSLVQMCFSRRAYRESF